jgi:hypothetical protein
MENELCQKIIKNTELLEVEMLLPQNQYKEMQFDLDGAKELGLSFTWVNPELKLPQLFFETNWLLISLLSSAYLSKSTREHILSMMLAPLTEEEKKADQTQPKPTLNT